MYRHSNNWRYYTTAILPLVALAAPAQAQQSDEMAALEERLERVEQELEDAEGDELPWDQYISELGGRVQLDQTFNLDASDDLEDVISDPLEDGAEFRRLRLYVEGAVAPWLDYKVQLDFAGGTELQDVYFKIHDLGAFPTTKIGNFKQPVSLQELTSSKYITLMSRSMLTDFFSPGHRTGIQFSKSFADERFNIAAGAFNSNFDSGEAETTGITSKGQWDISARITTPVIYRNDGRQVLHLGGSYLHRSYEDELEFGLEPEVHKTDDFVAGTILDVEHSNSFGLELAGVLGPAHLQGEYAQMDISRTTGKDPDVDSWYVQGGVFLTGEIRPYDKGDGDFGRVKPNSPFTGLGTGPGAWELAARYSTIDFTDVQDLAPAGFTPAFGTAEQAASEVDVYTLGLNWYPVAHARWMLNVVQADQDALGDATYITTRFQVDF